MKLLPYGEQALLAEFDDLESTIAAHSAMEGSRLAGVVELVPAARTVLVRIDPARIGLRAAAAWISALSPTDAPNLEAVEITVRVRYDGPDLHSVSAILGRSVEALVAWHLDSNWTCAFIGFAPGFAYLAGGGLDVPRLETSRTAVPAGSVGLAGEFTGIYPLSSPGGWQIIGTTDALLWDIDREPAALIQPGASVRFEAVAN